MDRRKLKIRPTVSKGSRPGKSQRRHRTRKPPAPTTGSGERVIVSPGAPEELLPPKHETIGKILTGFDFVPADLASRPLVLEIPAVPPSLNQLFGRAHWRRRKDLATQWHLLVRSAVNARPGQRLPAFVRRVNVWITVYHTGRMGQVLDSDNILDKLIIDGLKGTIIPDDSPRFVHWTATRSLPGSPGRTVIVVEAVE